MLSTVVFTLILLVIIVTPFLAFLGGKMAEKVIDEEIERNGEVPDIFTNPGMIVEAFKSSARVEEDTPTPTPTTNDGPSDPDLPW